MSVPSWRSAWRRPVVLGSGVFGWSGRWGVRPVGPPGGALPARIPLVWSGWPEVPLSVRSRLVAGPFRVRGGVAGWGGWSGGVSAGVLLGGRGCSVGPPDRHARSGRGVGPLPARCSTPPGPGVDVSAGRRQPAPQRQPPEAGGRGQRPAGGPVELGPSRRGASPHTPLAKSPVLPWGGCFSLDPLRASPSFVSVFVPVCCAGSRPGPVVALWWWGCSARARVPHWWSCCPRPVPHWWTFAPPRPALFAAGVPAAVSSCRRVRHGSPFRSARSWLAPARPLGGLCRTPSSSWWALFFAGGPEGGLPARRGLVLVCHHLEACAVTSERMSPVRCRPRASCRYPGADPVPVLPWRTSPFRAPVVRLGSRGLSGADSPWRMVRNGSPPVAAARCGPWRTCRHDCSRHGTPSRS